MLNIRRLKLRQRSGYFCGMMACNIAYSMVNTFLLIFFTDAVGLRPSVLSIMFLVTKLFDGVTDYIVGSFIDRTNTKWGRNKPWMIAGIPIFMIGFIMVFYAPSLASDLQLVYAYFSYILFCFGYTMINVPMNSIVPFMCDDPNERTVILSFGNVGGTLGVLIAIVGVPLMIQLNGGSGEVSGYTNTAILFAIISSLIYFLCVVMTKEVNLPVSTTKHTSMIQNLSSIMKNRPFIILLCYMLFNALSLAAMTSVITFYAKYILFDESQVTIVNLVFIVGSLFGLMFASSLGKRVSKKPLLMTLMGIQMFTWIGCWIAGSNLVLIYICVGIMSIAAGMINPNVFAILSESIDYGEYKTGRNLAGTQTAVFGLFNKIGSAMASSVVAFLLSIGSYNSQLSMQPDSAIFAIRFSLAGVCFLCTLIGFIAMMFYPINRQMLTKITEELRDKRKNYIDNHA